jgi:class 3 adenylate cyclase/putative methionine-R-sulfoxide reductase with GAF domain
MDWNRWNLRKRPYPSQLQAKLQLVFGLFFLFPAGGAIFFSLRYGLLTDEYVPYFFLGILVCSFAGLGLLKNLFRRIAVMSESIRSSPAALSGTDADTLPADDFHAIVASFQSLRSRFDQALRQLEQKSADIAVLKDLSELCYVTFDPEEILYITLERALLLTRSDLGSVLTLDMSEPKSFCVKTTMGLGEHIKAGDRIDFASSIAKYAVINKAPLVVDDIETDKRFGRCNRPHYGSGAFVCMPLKTRNTIIGVLTISSRDPRRKYSQDEIDILTPLVSNAAFTFENLRLLRENERAVCCLRAIDQIFTLLNSSFRNADWMPAVLHELHAVVPFEAAGILVPEEIGRKTVQVREWISYGSSAVLKNTEHGYEGSIVEKALQQESALILEPPPDGMAPLDQALFRPVGDGSCFLAPLRTAGRILGILVLVGRSRTAFFESQNWVNWIAGGMALALDRNRLSDAVFKRAHEIETIRQVGSALASSTFDLNKVLQYTLDMIREAINVEAGSLLFLKGQELEVAVSFNGSRLPLPNSRWKLGQGIAGHVAARGEAVIVNDTQKVQQFFPLVDAVSGIRTRSALCVPMISQGCVIGVIEVRNKVSGPFDTNDRDLLQAIATSVSIALENARLYQQTVAAAEHERGVRRLFQTFVPKAVVDRIIHGLEGGRPVIEEVKTITLLNIDIRGFSRLARQIGPPKTVALLNRFFEAMGELVFAHHGIVDKYLGDGFLAVFGAPVSNIADADNALHAALGMKRSLAEMNVLLGRELGLTLEMGISVHTGEVVAGNIGFEKKMDYTVIGDAVNTVFRLQGLAKSFPNGILISDATLQAVRSRPVVHAACVPPDFQRDLGSLKVYELLELDKPGGSL